MWRWLARVNEILVAASESSAPKHRAPRPSWTTKPATPDATEPIYIPAAEMLPQAWTYYMAAKEADDVATMLRWLEAIDLLLDRLPRHE